MIKILIPISLLGMSVGLFSCVEEGVTPTNCRQGRCTYVFFKGEGLFLDERNVFFNFSLNPNTDSLIFQYFYERSESPLIPDDSYNEIIMFQVGQAQDSFSFSNSSMRGTGLFILIDDDKRSEDFQDRREGIRIDRGSINGVKTEANRWQVDMDLRFILDGQEEVRQIRASFEMRE